MPARVVWAVSKQKETHWVGVLCEVVDVALPEHAGAVVGVEAQGDALLFGVGAHGVGHIAHLIQHLRVSGALAGAVVAEAGVLAVIPLDPHGGAEVDLGLGDADGLLHVEGEVAVEVHQLYAALFRQVDELLGVIGVVVPDEGEVLHRVVAQEFALRKGLLQLALAGLGVLGVDPGPPCVSCFHN